MGCSTTYIVSFFSPYLFVYSRWVWKMLRSNRRDWTRNLCLMLNGFWWSSFLIYWTRHRNEMKWSERKKKLLKWIVKKNRAVFLPSRSLELPNYEAIKGKNSLSLNLSTYQSYRYKFSTIFGNDSAMQEAYLFNTKYAVGNVLVPIISKSLSKERCKFINTLTLCFSFTVSHLMKHINKGSEWVS